VWGWLFHCKKAQYIVALFGNRVVWGWLFHCKKAQYIVALFGNRVTNVVALEKHCVAERRKIHVRLLGVDSIWMRRRSNCQTKKLKFGYSPIGSPAPRQTGRQTVGRNLTWNWTWVIALQITGPSSGQRGRPTWKIKNLIVTQINVTSGHLLQRGCGNLPHERQLLSWNSAVSNPSGEKLLQLFYASAFEISAPQYPTITPLWEMEMYWILWCIRISESQMSLFLIIRIQITYQ
jgi:hypothetical protein